MLRRKWIGSSGWDKRGTSGLFLLYKELHVGQEWVIGTSGQKAVQKNVSSSQDRMIPVADSPEFECLRVGFGGIWHVAIRKIGAHSARLWRWRAPGFIYTQKEGSQVVKTGPEGNMLCEISQIKTKSAWAHKYVSWRESKQRNYIKLKNCVELDRLCLLCMSPT